FYHHCANIIIEGTDTGKLPELAMTIVNVEDLGQKLDTSAVGDDKDNTSTGPMADEVKLNREGFFAFGGGAGKKGFDLGLVKSKGSKED
ncbi:hypothetical protein BGZ65_000821, partial [Modicella reniformis]